jgi:FAD/FMN-containing dehydrogenase
MAYRCSLAIGAAWAEAGLTAGEYTKAAGAYGLATGFGDTGSVGIGGLTLGGGVGFLVRKYGLTIDDLLAAEIVTADGQTLLWTPARIQTCSGRFAAVATTAS